jgi:thiamine-phosphate pyrophosphorylase
LAIKFKTDGIYIPSFNKRITLSKASLGKNFKIIGSAHNQMEIKKKIDQGVRQYFYRPYLELKRVENIWDLQIWIIDSQV